MSGDPEKKQSKGMSSASSASSSAPATSSPPSVTISLPVDQKESKYDNDVIQILDDLEYKGFEPREFRNGLKGKTTGKNVITCLSAYVQIGNNPRNSESKRRKKPITGLGNGLLNKDITLARLAIAFMPMLYLIRSIAEGHNKLRNQFPASKVPPLYQDVAFSGWKNLEILPFLIAFDNALARTGGKNQQHGEDEVLRWMNVAQSGFEADLEVKELLTGNINKAKIIAWFDGYFP